MGRKQEVLSYAGKDSGQRFFHGLFVSFLMMLTMGSGMGEV